MSSSKAWSSREEARKTHLPRGAAKIMASRGRFRKPFPVQLCVRSFPLTLEQKGLLFLSLVDAAKRLSTFDSGTIEVKIKRVVRD